MIDDLAYLKSVRKLLAHHFPEPEAARRLLSDAGFEHIRIQLHGAPEDLWFSALEEAQRQKPGGAIGALLSIVVREKPGAIASITRPGDTLREYLELRKREFEWLSVPGLRRVKLPLREVFVELRLREDQPGLEHDWPRRLARDENGPAATDSGALGLQEAIARAMGRGKVGLVLLGDPGAGKTTLLEHLFCRVQDEGSTHLGFPPDLVPLFLRFAQLDLEVDLKPRGLLAFAVRDIVARNYPGAGTEFAAATGSKLLFLLDGLDEVRDEHARVQVCQWLDRELHHFPQARFVATCRFAAWQREATLGNRFLAADVLALDREKVELFVQRWYAAYEKDRAGPSPGEQQRAHARAQERARDLVRELFDRERQASERVRDMTRNPLLLATICLTHLEEHRLPERRIELYDRCLRLLLETWSKERGDGSAVLPHQASREILQPLAWAMHEQQTTRLERQDIQGVLAGPYGQVQWAGKPDLDTFLRLARDECGVLTGSDVDEFEFLHLSFQEYLAAAHAVQTGQVRGLAERLGESFWRETILLAVAMSGGFAPFLQSVVGAGRVAAHQDLLAECFREAVRIDPSPFEALLAPRQSPLARLARWLRRASARSEAAEICAALELLRDRDLDQVKAWASALISHPDEAVRLMARRVAGRSAPPNVLATQPRETREGLPALQGIAWVWVPPGEFLMGSSQTSGAPGYDSDAHVTELAAHGVTLHHGFFMACHPLTNASYASYLAATGAAEPALWSDRRFNAGAQPVVGIAFDEAQAFCQWLSQHLPQRWRADLPTEAEWEFAARGTDGRKYPWGNEPPDEHRAVYATDRPAPVGGRPAGASPFGCEDMAGNVWEWCLDAWRNAYPSSENGAIDPCHEGPPGSVRVVRGGSWFDVPGDLRAAQRSRFRPSLRFGLLGFRVVCRRPREHVDT